MTVAIGSMKALDIFARRDSLPIYTAGKQPPDWHFALILLTELRYESFTPNHIRVPMVLESFNEATQLGIHVGIFTILQTLPQRYPMVLAFEVLLAIYIIWTSLQMVVRYKSSPAMFGPLYMADSLTGFWYVWPKPKSPSRFLYSMYKIRSLIQLIVHTGQKHGTTHSHPRAPPSPTDPFAIPSPKSACQSPSPAPAAS